MIRRLLPTCIVLFAILAGCRAGPSDEAVAALANDLKATFPNQIAFIDWENAPPMDPPAILIDFERGLSDAELLGLLCNQIKPRVIAVHPDIDVFANGWTISEHCR